MSTTFAKKRLAVYLAVTFVLTWAIVITAGIATGAFVNGELATPAVIAPVGISMFAPLVGALVANRACGESGRIDLCFRPRIKGNVRFYLAAWFVPALATLLGCVLFFALNPQLFDPTLTSYLNSVAGSAVSQQLADQMPVVIASTIVASLTIAPFINAIPAFGEEAGWRGMLFPTLCELMSERAAVIVSGVIWGLWHAPVIAMGHNYGMGYLGFPWTGIIVMIVACTTLGAGLSYLRLRTQSVLPCALAHGAVNAVANIGIVFCAAGQTLAGPSPLGYIAGIPIFIIGIVCISKLK